MDGCLLLIPIGLILSVVFTKIFMHFLYFVVYLINDYECEEDKGYQEWKKKVFRGEDNES